MTTATTLRRRHGGKDRRRHAIAAATLAVAALACSAPIAWAISDSAVDEYIPSPPNAGGGGGGGGSGGGGGGSGGSGGGGALGTGAGGGSSGGIENVPLGGSEDPTPDPSAQGADRNRDSGGDTDRSDLGVAAGGDEPPSGPPAPSTGAIANHAFSGEAGPLPALFGALLLITGVAVAIRNGGRARTAVEGPSPSLG